MIVNIGSMDGTDVCRVTIMCQVVSCGQYIVYILISGAPCPKVLFYQLNKFKKGVHESEATCPKSHDLQVFLLFGICSCMFSMTISTAFLTGVGMPFIDVRSQNSGHRRIPEISVSSSGLPSEQRIGDGTWSLGFFLEKGR